MLKIAPNVKCLYFHSPRLKRSPFLWTKRTPPSLWSRPLICSSSSPHIPLWAQEGLHVGKLQEGKKKECIVFFIMLGAAAKSSQKTFRWSSPFHSLLKFGARKVKDETVLYVIPRLMRRRRQLTYSRLTFSLVLFFGAERFAKRDRKRKEENAAVLCTAAKMVKFSNGAKNRIFTAFIQEWEA